ncbi:MAG: DNA-3-methyladenine glycosylase, partial [Bacteroidota bacterium]
MQQNSLEKLPRTFFIRDVLEVAPELPGRTLVRRYDDNSVQRFIITEVEAYRGTEDLACHASKGNTPRTEVIFREGGLVYVYLIYGMYWMFNIVTGEKNDASA